MKTDAEQEEHRDVVTQHDHWYRVWKQRLRLRSSVRKVLRSSESPILVYQMGKVASTSIEKALQARPEVSSFHVHFLNLDHIREVHSARRRQGWAQPDGGLRIQRMRCRELRRLVDTGCPVRVISLIREPIGRNFAAYFQTLDRVLGVQNAHQRLPLAQLAEGFVKHFDHEFPLRWFDWEFKKVLGIDIYSHSFPHGEGHWALETDQYQVLILRHDLDDAEKAHCLEDFLGINDVVIPRHNVGGDKPYADTYRSLRDELKLTPAFLDHALESNYARHFFSEQERDSIRERWISN